MERITLRLPTSQIEEIEALVEGGEYINRSAAIRAGVLAILKEHRRIDGRRPKEVPADAD